MAHSPWKKSWNRKRSVAQRKSARQLGRWKRALPLELEFLEIRTLLAVSVTYDAGNAATILGSVGDQVWLRTSGNILQYSADSATNYTNLSLNLTQDVTLTFGDMGQVHLAGLVGEGNAFTFQALGAASGAGGQLASPNLFSVDGNVNTEGGDLSILNMQGVEVESNVTVSTRDVGSSTSYLTAASVGNSGSLTFTSENPDTLNPILNVDFNHPQITLDSGAQLLAQVLPTNPYTAGDVTLSAQNTNYSLGSSTWGDISVLAREASISLEGATVMGGSVDIESDAGDLDLLEELSELGGGNGTWATGLIENALPFITSFITSTLHIPSLPISFLFKKADATVEVGQGTAQNFAATQVNGTTGEITFGSATNLTTGDPVTYTSSGTAIGGLTSGATYFAIVDSSTTLRLASSEANALSGIPIKGLNAGSASGTQSLSPDSQISGSSVNLATNAQSVDEGSAVYSGSGAAGFAGAIAIGMPSAQTLVNSGSQITSTGNVDVTSDAQATTGLEAGISQNLGEVTSIFEHSNSGANQPRWQLAAALGVDSLTANSIVSQYANIDAGANASITATGSNYNKNVVYSASYFDGNAGVTAAFNFSMANVQAEVDGDVTAGGPGSIGNGPTAPVSLTFNPFTSVHGSNDPTEPNTIDFGTTNPGLKTAEEIVYDSGLGGAVNGLTSGDTYYVINTSVPGSNDYRIQLAPTLSDALSDTNIIDIPPNPTLTDKTTGVTLPFTDVSEADSLTRSTPART